MGFFRNQQSQTEDRRRLRNEATPAEVLLWRCLKGRNLEYKFRRQHGIGPFILDFFCPKLRLAIELDGMTHTTEDEIEYDKRRDAFMSQLGITTMRFSNTEVYDAIDFTIKKIQDQIHIQCKTFDIDDYK